MTPRAAIRNERGFALMGAVMFVLVLTILALSLFSLSSFEGQFMRDSMDRSAAYNAALGGLERARFALGRMNSKLSVTDGLPRDSVIYAVAWQNGDSTSEVVWSGPNANDVTIRVKARYGGEVRFLEATYAADQNRSFYRNLMTLSHPTQGLFVFRVDPDGNEPNEFNSKATRLLPSWVNQNALNSPDLIFPIDWNSTASPPRDGYTAPGPGTIQLKYGGVQDPLVAPYIALHSQAPGTSTITEQPGSNPYILNALNDPDSIKFFRTPGPDGDWSLDLNKDDNVQPRFQVSGTVVWMFPQGLRVDHQLQVVGSGRPQPNNDMLVLVGGAQNGDPQFSGAGIALLSSIEPTTVPVILISDGNVLLYQRDFGSGQWNDDNISSGIECLSIYARRALIMGPDANGVYDSSGPKMILGHPETHPGNAIIDRLVEMGLLPNTQGVIKGKLSPVAGTWREVTETNPVFP